MKKEDKKDDKKKDDKKSSDSAPKKKQRGSLNDLVYRTNSFDPKDEVDMDFDEEAKDGLKPTDEYFDLPDGLASDGSTIVEDAPDHSPDTEIARRLKDGLGAEDMDYDPLAEDDLDMPAPRSGRLAGPGAPSDQSATEALITDPRAPESVRLEAIQRIRRKYLGQ